MLQTQSGLQADKQTNGSFVASCGKENILVLNTVLPWVISRAATLLWSNAYGVIFMLNPNSCINRGHGLALDSYLVDGGVWRDGRGQISHHSYMEMRGVESMRQEGGEGKKGKNQSSVFRRGTTMQ